MIAAIHINLPREMVVFKQHNDHSGRLDDLQREGDEHDARNTGWKTAENGVLRLSGGPRSVAWFGLFVYCLRPRLHRRLVLSEGISRFPLHPDARQVGHVWRGVAFDRVILRGAFGE